MSSQEEKKQDWEKWRKETSDKLEKIEKSLSSERQLLKAPESLPFDAYMKNHVKTCPECQKVLEKHGYTKKEEKKEPGKTTEEKKKKPWSVSDV